MFNGRTWNGLSADAKMGYAMAAFDYSHYAHLVGDNEPTSFDLIANVSLGTYVSQIDALYRDAANASIPLPFALQYCSAELSGLKTKQQLQALLTNVRNATSSLLKRGAAAIIFLESTRSQKPRSRDKDLSRTAVARKSSQ